MITVILNGYKRKENLTEQYRALQNQTIKPSETLLWYNSPEEGDYNYELGRHIPVAYCNYNFGVWARFAFALLAKSEYVCIFDDDTIPGSKWLENCYSTMQQHEGLLGTVGLLYTNPSPAESVYCSYYEPYVRYGWPNPTEEVKQVDLVGHSWFFKKEWLQDYWREIPSPKYNLCGEDMHFSYILQKYTGLNTYVPPHPVGDREMWGSLRGDSYGADEHSLWENNKVAINGVPFRHAMNEFFIKQRRKGWRLVNESR